MNKVKFNRKPYSLGEVLEPQFPTDNLAYNIVATIELSDEEYDQFTSNFYNDQEFIIAHNKQMHVDRNEIANVICVIAPNREWALLINSEGYDYARYVAKVSKTELCETCVICETPITDRRQACDPFPISETGKACKDCDMRVVTPARIKLAGITMSDHQIEAMVQAEKQLREQFTKR